MGCVSVMLTVGTYFNPRSPHGERHDGRGGSRRWQGYFNPRSPHGERPYGQKRLLMLLWIFQSTLPARGATYEREYERGAKDAISIHAPRTGSDPTTASSKPSTSSDFNPRSPHGERRGKSNTPSRRRKNFNPRSPHGERPSLMVARAIQKEFQSTLPARGATDLFQHLCGFSRVFQSTLPARGAT